MSKRILFPNSDRVLVSLVLNEKKGLLFVPEAFRESNYEPRLARVIAVGTGKVIDPVNGEPIPPLFATDDLVLIDTPAGLKLSLDDEEFVLVRNEEILGTIMTLDEKPDSPLKSV